MRDLILAILLVVCSAHPCQAVDPATTQPTTIHPSDTRRIEGLVYITIGDISENEYQRILQSPEMVFVHIQVSLNSPSHSELLKRRLIELRKAGKKVILQVWYGPGDRYNWSYHSVAAIGRDPGVATDFLAGFDAVLDSLGAENLYGVVLGEENGHFGFDIDQPGDWNQNRTGIVSGSEGGLPYDNYQNYEAFGGAWSPGSPNVRRFKDHLTAVTGVSLDDPSSWSRDQAYAYSQWARRDLYGATQRVISNHMRQRHPHLRFFAWDIRLGHANLATAWDFAEGSIQGFIADPYSGTLMNYHTFANIRTLHPQAELVGLMWGGYASYDIKARRLATAYICGANGLGFFEGSGTDPNGMVFMRREGQVIQKTEGEQTGIQSMDYADDETFSANRKMVDAFAKLPPFRFKPKTLVVSGDIVSNGTTAMEWTQSFYNYPAHCHASEAHGVRLREYELLVVHHGTPLLDQHAFTSKYGVPGTGIDGGELDEFVNQGGLAVIYGLPEGWDKTFLGSTLNVRAEPNEVPFQGVYQPSPWLQTTFRIKRSYNLGLTRRALQSEPAGLAYADELIHVLTYGKGKVLWLPFVNRTPLSGNLYHPEQFADYVQLLQDLTYGFCLGARGQTFADQEINDPSVRIRYFKANDSQSKVVCVILKDEVPDGEMLLEGTDLLSGIKNPALNKDRTVAVLKTE